MTDNLTRRAVVFGIDGVRFDTLQQARTPCLDAVAADGFLAPVRVNDAAPTISGPGWTTIATGVLADRHQIFDNDLSGHRIDEAPDFLTRVRAAIPGAVTYAARPTGPRWCTRPTADRSSGPAASTPATPDSSSTHGTTPRNSSRSTPPRCSAARMSPPRSSTSAIPT